MGPHIPESLADIAVHPLDGPVFTPLQEGSDLEVGLVVLPVEVDRDLRVALFRPAGDRLDLRRSPGKGFFAEDHPGGFPGRLENLIMHFRVGADAQDVQGVFRQHLPVVGI